MRQTRTWKIIDGQRAETARAHFNDARRIDRPQLLSDASGGRLAF